MTEIKSGTTKPVPGTFPKRDGIEPLNSLIGTEWDWWFPQSPPVEDVAKLVLNREPSKGVRNIIEYAGWLKDWDRCRDHGVYIWLIPRGKDDQRLRFVHVGRSTGTSTTMRTRTREHCLNQFRPKGPDGWRQWCTCDRIYKLPLARHEGDEFGSLAKCECLWDGDEVRARRISPPSVRDRFDAASKFLNSVRIVFLTPTGANAKQAATQVKWMEAVIGVAAAQLLDPSLDARAGKSAETTNSFTGEMNTLRKQCGPLPGDELKGVASWLNEEIEEMLPTTPRSV